MAKCSECGKSMPDMNIDAMDGHDMDLVFRARRRLPSLQDLHDGIGETSGWSGRVCAKCVESNRKKRRKNW